MKKVLPFFLSLFFCQLAFAQSAKIDFDKYSHYFGAVLQGQVTSFEFDFENTGQKPLSIKKIKTGTNLIAEWPRTQIGPSERGTIKIYFQTQNEIGVQIKDIMVVTNSSPKKVKLRLVGEVVLDESKVRGPRIPNPPVENFDPYHAVLPLTQIAWEDDHHDFGEIKAGDKVSHTFHFSNAGNNPLRIENVKPSCGCTSPEWSKREIAPGESGFIKIIFDSKNKQGYQKKSISVVANTEPRNSILIFTGEVSEFPNSKDGIVELKPLVENGTKNSDGLPKFSETEVDFGKVNAGEEREHVFTLSNHRTTPLTISEVFLSTENIKVEYPKEAIQPGEKAEIRIHYHTDGLEGMHDRLIQVMWDNGKNGQALRILLEIE